MTNYKRLSLSSICTIFLFAAPKKKTSKSKTNSRFAHWFSKPQDKLKVLESSRKQKTQNSPQKALGFGEIPQKVSPKGYEKKTLSKTKALEEEKKVEE